MKNHSKLRYYYLMLMLLILVTKTVQADWDNECPKYCKCKWQSGKRYADCSESSLTTVPNSLSRDVQVLDLSSNQISKLPKHVFKDVEMTYLHILHLKRCGIYEVHKDAFEGLTILIELHLSDNFIHYLHPNTFQHLIKLRNLYIVNNTLEVIEKGMFSNLNYLQNVDLSNNNLTSVSEQAFRNDPKLQTIVLKNNKLKHMKPLILDYTRPEEKLTSLVLFGNQWKCDCHLKAFRNWTIENNLYTRPTECKEPSHLRGGFWNNISPEKFACKPVILEPDVGTSITLKNDNERTLYCKVYGDPIPSIHWKLNNKIIEDDPRIRNQEDKHFIIGENGYDNIRYVNLTIRNPRPQDRGELVCTAKNPGGTDERNISVLLSAGMLPGLDSESDPRLMILIIGIILGLFLLFIVLIFLFCCLWQKRKLIPTKNDANRTNGGASIDDTEMEKSLITAVNPVTKPPRRCEAPPSVASCGTEMSDLNRTLLDNDSVFNSANGVDEENRSLEGFDPNLKQLKEIPVLDLKRSDRPYPPDLLSFPARSQISPAGSCASTILDYSRPPAIHGPQSPLHSPMYGTLPSNLFRTLPYSRSHSPFTSPLGVPVVQSRQGYVTIPRRPRVPSWSAPSSTLSNDSGPFYDNLGPRSTARGSVSSQASMSDSNPMSMRGRPLPATPAHQQNGLPVYYTPIVEHESPPAPCPAPRPLAARSGSLQRFPISPPSDKTSLKDISWTTRLTPDGLNLGETATSEEPISASPTPSSVNGTLGRSPKVPPKIPPKPKKKTVVSGPLFEDEGEDGTEV